MTKAWELGCPAYGLLAFGWHEVRVVWRCGLALCCVFQISETWCVRFSDLPNTLDGSCLDENLFG